MNKNMKNMHYTMRGKPFNMDQLRQKNELTIAVGNMPVNARGDIVGKGGQIIKTKESVNEEYYSNLNALPEETVNTKNITPTQVVEEVTENTAVKKTSKKEKWVEDENGNFVLNNNG
jgi:hypothetical protein